MFGLTIHKPKIGVIDLIVTLYRYVFKFCIAIPCGIGMVSEKQREIIIALGIHNENHHVAHDNIKISREAMRMRLSRAFIGFMEDLDLFHEYYAVFENSFKKNPDAYTKLRSIARRIKQ